jgi:hypothetical protein
MLRTTIPVLRFIGVRARDSHLRPGGSEVAGPLAVLRAHIRRSKFVPGLTL